MSSNDNKPERIDETWVVHTATLAGLTIAPERLPGVVATLQRLVDVAQVVNDVPLTVEDDLAPVWKP